MRAARALAQSVPYAPADCLDGDHPSLATALTPSQDDPDQDDFTLSLADVLAGLRIPPPSAFLPRPGTARRCCWCERVEFRPGESDAPTFISDGICLSCLVTVQLHQQARWFRVILLPNRMLDDERLHVPLTVRLFAQLQRMGAGNTWISANRQQLADHFRVGVASIYRATAQLEAGRYLQRRVRHTGHGAKHEVRLHYGGPTEASEYERR